MGKKIEIHRHLRYINCNTSANTPTDFHIDMFDTRFIQIYRMYFLPYGQLPPPPYYTLKNGILP